MNVLKNFPDKEELIKHANGSIYDVNGHIHTPYSFSAFDSIDQVFQLAGAENVKAVGINDFIVTDGYDEFNKHAVKNRIFPLFNIEFMGLIREMQEKGVRINDPSNPGRIYFSGKGLRYPVSNDGQAVALLNEIKRESNAQTASMTEKLNRYLQDINAPFALNYDEIKSGLAEDLVRERHLAKALRIKIFDAFNEDAGRQDFLTRLYNGQSSGHLSNISALENEIRSKLLKKGGVAYVEEDDKAFPVLEKIIQAILELGGIPCYPVLLDDAKGNYTEFEQDFDQLHSELSARNVFAVELIPGRNDLREVRRFVKFFREKNFVITLGSEHNTPEMIPMKVDCRGGVPLDEELKRINYEGVCVIAAHQFLTSKGEEGFIDQTGKARLGQIDEFVRLGKGVFNYFLNN